MPAEPGQLPGNLVAVPGPQGHDGSARYQVQAEQILRRRPPHQGLTFEAHVEDDDVGGFRERARALPITHTCEVGLGGARARENRESGFLEPRGKQLSLRRVRLHHQHDPLSITILSHDPESAWHRSPRRVPEVLE